MSFTIKKIFKTNPLTSIILLLLPILPFLMGVKPQFIIHLLVILCIWIDKKSIVTTKYKFIVLLLLIPILWSFFNSLDAGLHEMVQALFYLTTPFTMVIVGIQLFNFFSDLNTLFKYIIYSGTIGSILYVIVGISKIGMSSNIFLDLYQIREVFFWGSIANILAIIIILFSEKYGHFLIGNSKHKYILIAINLVALLLMASRTYYLIFLLFILIIFYNFKKKYFFSLCFIFVFILGIILNSNSDSTMIKKIQSSSDEMFATQETVTDEFVNTYYRSYETQRTLKTFFEGTELELIFGHGYQKLIDLNIYVALGGGDNYLKFIPIIHNGYAYLLFRTGFMGIIFFVIFFTALFFIKNRKNEFTFFNLLYLGCIMALLVSNYVVTTFFSKEMLFAWIFIGLNISYAGKVKKYKL